MDQGSTTRAVVIWAPVNGRKKPGRADKVQMVKLDMKRGASWEQTFLDWHSRGRLGGTAGAGESN